jgi:hypothetical protein
MTMIRRAQIGDLFKVEEDLSIGWSNVKRNELLILIKFEVENEFFVSMRFLRNDMSLLALGWPKDHFDQFVQDISQWFDKNFKKVSC